MKNKARKAYGIGTRITSLLLCAAMLLLIRVPSVQAVDNDGLTEEPAVVTETAAPEAAEETSASAEETTAPAEETTAPAEETTAPAEETTAPAEETTAPAEETTAPAEETAVETTAPVQDATTTVYQELIANTGELNANNRATVTVAGNLPEGTTVSITKLAANTQKHADAAAELEKKALESEKFLAFDITIRDAAGNEIEPDETVSVSLSLGKNLLPQEANLDALSVVHMEEDASGQIANAVDVTAPADATVDVASDNSVDATFKTNSFSTFTITWGDYFEVTVHYVNTNGQEISEVTHQNVTISRNNTITFSTLAPTVSGLTYQSAHYQTYNGAAITSVTATRDDNIRTLTFKNNGTFVGSITRASSENTKTADVYLVYESTSTPPEATETKSLSRDKTVILNADGTYDLSLTVSGAVGSVTNKAKLDILLIIDKSGSMKWGMTNNSNASSPNRRIDKVAAAVSSLTSTISANASIDAKYNVVTFSNNSKTSCVQSWTNNAALVNQTVSNINPNGGTNYQAGIYTGKTQLASARSDAQKIVIFLTDGLPTRRGITGSESGNGQDDSNNYNINAAIAEIQSMSCNAFYAIGAGPDFASSTSSTAQAVTNLQSLCDNVGTAAGATRPTIRTKYSATNTADLNAAFANIAADSTSILCDHVTITDTLSQNVDLVMQGGSPKKLQVTVTNNTTNQVVATGSGSVALSATQANAAATLTASYDSATRQLKLAFPDSYKLEANYTYKITTTIDATEAAYEAYRANGNLYGDLADDNTGTHAGAYGMYSNTSAAVTYTYNGETSSAAYPKPVIQLHPATLTITKTVSGLSQDAAAMATLVNQLTFTVTLNGAAEEYQLDDFNTVDNQNFSYTISGLSPNTTYSVAESGADISADHAFSVTATSNGTSGTLAKDGSATAAFTNAYAVSSGALVIKKTVTAENAARLADVVEALNQTLSFTYGDTTTADATYADGIYTVTINDVPAGTYDFSENNYEVEGYTCTPSGVPSEITVTAGVTTTVEFSNDYAMKRGAIQITKNLVDEQGKAIAAKADATYVFSINGTTIAGEAAHYTLAVTVKKGASSATATLNGVLYGTYNITEQNSVNSQEGTVTPGTVTVSDAVTSATASVLNTYEYHMQTSTAVAVNEFTYTSESWSWERATIGATSFGKVYEAPVQDDE